MCYALLFRRFWFLQFFDCSLPDSSAHGIFQSRILEWVAISSTRESSQPRNSTLSPALRANSLLLNHQGSPHCVYIYIYHILLTHLSVNGHLCYFNILAIVNKCCYKHGCTVISLRTWYQFFVVYTQECNCRIIWFFWVWFFSLFENSPYCFPQWCTLYIPINVTETFQSLHILTSLCFLCLFLFLSVVVILMSTSWSRVHLLCIPKPLEMLSIFSCAYWPFIYHLWRNVYLRQAICPFWIGSFVLLLVPIRCIQVAPGACTKSACQRAQRWETGRYSISRKDLKLTKMNYDLPSRVNSFSWNLSAFKGFQSSKIVTSVGFCLSVPVGR